MPDLIRPWSGSPAQSWCLATKFDDSIFYFYNTDARVSLAGNVTRPYLVKRYSVRPSAVPEQAGLI